MRFRRPPAAYTPLGTGEKVGVAPSEGSGRKIDPGASAGPKIGSDGLLVALPWPPSVNGYYRHVVVKGSVRVLISAEGRRYSQVVGVMMSRLRDRAPAPPHAVTVALHPPTRARIDLDNRMKGLLDAVYKAIGMDDSVIDSLTIERASVLAGGRALVLIETAGTPREEV